MKSLEDAVAEAIRLHLPSTSRGSRIEALKHVRGACGCDLRTAVQALDRAVRSSSA